MSQAVVVIPCYNEARRLDVRQYRDFVRRAEGVALLLVNDGSTDQTSAILHQLHREQPDRVHVHELARNVGKAEAVRQGVLQAFQLRASVVGYWDADLATPLDAILQFREVLDRQPHLRLVMGSRVALLGRRIERRFRRHLLGRVFATAVSWMLGIAVYDTQCGAKMFRRSPEIEAIFQRPFCSRWIFDVELLARLLERSRTGALPPVEQIVFELPLDRWREVGGSKLKGSDFIRAALELRAIRSTYRLGWRSSPPAWTQPHRAAADGAARGRRHEAAPDASCRDDERRRAA